MNSPWTRRARLATLVLLGVGALGSCRRGNARDTATTTSRPPPPTGSVAEKEAAMLGRDVFGLIDRLAAYAASNQRKYPATLREAGIDSLTPSLARHIDTRAAPPMAFSMFRKPLGHLLTSCRGTTDLLEESALNDGHITVICTDSTGRSSPYTVQRAAGR